MLPEQSSFRITEANVAVVVSTDDVLCRVVAVAEKDRQREVDSDVEFNGVFILSSRGRRICQLLRLSPSGQCLLGVLCF